MECVCGLNLPQKIFVDARGIPLFWGCPKCAPQRLKRYRPEVLSDPNYHASEPIEPADDD